MGAQQDVGVRLVDDLLALDEETLRDSAPDMKPLHRKLILAAVAAARPKPPEPEPSAAPAPAPASIPAPAHAAYGSPGVAPTSQQATRARLGA